MAGSACPGAVASLNPVSPLHCDRLMGTAAVPQGQGVRTPVALKGCSVTQTRPHVSAPEAGQKISVFGQVREGGKEGGLGAARAQLGEPAVDGRRSLGCETKFLLQHPGANA